MALETVELIRKAEAEAADIIAAAKADAKKRAAKAADECNALDKEAAEIIKNIPQDAYLAAMCVEGIQMASEELAELVTRRALSGRSKLCFVIGGSYGISPSVKKRADIRLSMSKMTFPHHLARVMLAEQIYRAFKINEGSRYHK
mgnify:CR=1 FL=1